MPTVLAVAIGSAFGGALRYGVANAMAMRGLTAWPLGTLLVNIVGSFVLGALVRYSTLSPGLNPQVQQFIGAGFCGGLTTFSALSVETLGLIQAGALGRAVLYVVISVGAGLGAAVLGMRAVGTVGLP